jgi:hypothetical protein
MLQFSMNYSHVSTNTRIHYANQINHKLYKDGLDLTGTPLFYAMFALLPLDYNLAFYIYEQAAIISLILGFIIIFSLCRQKLLLFLILSLFVIFEYGPLFSDLRVGNINCFQFFAFATITSLLKRFQGSNSVRYKYIASTMFMCFMVFLILMKPNMMIIIVLLPASVWVLHGTRSFALSSAIAGLFGIVLMVVSGIYFGSMMIWMDWLNYFSHGTEKLSYPVSHGNYSTVVIISNLLNVSVNITMMSVALILSALALCVLLRRVNSDDSVLVKLSKSITMVLRDPYVSAAIGVTLTLAISPLVWFHYNIIILLPALWLCLYSKRWSILELCAIISIWLTSGVFPKPLQTYNIAPYLIAFGWMPVWGCILIKIAGRNKDPDSACIGLPGSQDREFQVAWSSVLFLKERLSRIIHKPEGK